MKEHTSHETKLLSQGVILQVNDSIPFQSRMVEIILSVLNGKLITEKPQLDHVDRI